MTHRTHAVVVTLLASTLALAFAGLGYPYASDVITVVTAPSASGDPLQMTGPPEGEGLYVGSDDVYQLGGGGQVVLELGAAAADKPGTDLIIYENPFLILSGTDSETWVEAVTVEVSSNSFDWAAFPTSFAGTPGPYGLFQGVPRHWYRGFAGVSPFAAAPLMGVDPADVVAGGGDVFDLADLRDDPLVIAELVDLEEIKYVRLTDVAAGVAMDTAGNIVWDCGSPTFAGADIDAVFVTNSGDISTVGRPWVELSMEEFPNGTYMVLEMGDPDGLWDIIPAITASSNGQAGSFYNLIKFFTILELDDHHVRMAAGPVIPQLPPTQFRVGVTDGTGQKSGDAVYVP